MCHRYLPPNRIPRLNWRINRAIASLPALFLTLLLCACSSMPPADVPKVTLTGSGAPPAKVVDEALRWHAVRFRFRRDAVDETRSYLDALVADQVLADIIARHRDGIALWRFHRRWPDDPTGHQFSFLIYAPQAIAERVFAAVRHHERVEQLRDEGYLRGFVTHQVGGKQSADIAATSDAAWPPVIQREWPYFIHGASRMWLGLVQDTAATQSQPGLHERYKSVEEAIEKLWYRRGNHALFHHLSALFGYRPLRVIRRDDMTF